MLWRLCLRETTQTFVVPCVIVTRLDVEVDEVTDVVWIESFPAFTDFPCCAFHQIDQGTPVVVRPKLKTRNTGVFVFVARDCVINNKQQMRARGLSKTGAQDLVSHREAFAFHNEFTRYSGLWLTAPVSVCWSLWCWGEDGCWLHSKCLSLCILFPLSRFSQTSNWKTFRHRN